MSGLLREGRIAFWSGVGLFLLFGSLTSYDLYAVYFPPARYEANEALLGELQATPLKEAPRETVAIGDWPQWGGPGRNGVSRETGLLTTWPADGLPVLWRAKCGEGYSTVVAAEGRVFTLWREIEQEEEVIGCWDAATGKELWRHRYSAPCKLPMYGSGPRSTPTIDMDRIYTVGATCILHCLDVKTGQVIWRKDLLKEFDAPNLLHGTSFSPLIEGELLLTNPGGKNGHCVVALNKRTGDKVWANLDGEAGYSSPIAVTAAGVRQIVFFLSDCMVGLSPKDGKLYWRYPWPHGGANVVTPMAQDDYMFFTSGYQKGCVLLKAVKTDDGVRVERVYELLKMSVHFSSCFLYKEHVFGFPDPGMLTCMEFRTGKICWQKRGFGKGTCLAVDGNLIVLDESGKKLALIEATAAGYREKASCVLKGQKCWSAPSLAHGRLYLRTQEELICFDMSGSSEVALPEGNSHHD